MRFFEDGPFSAPKVEEKVLAFWEANHIFEKTLEKTKDGKPYTFYDGPPFATGIPHYGHMLASTMKDLIPRYQTMKGRFVRRRWGWDCHGLPIEEIVERKLGISGKKQIEEIGVAKFNETCRDTVLQYAEEWGKMVRRLGRWVDFDNSYKTMDRDYMESVWWGFKQLYDKGLIYEGRKVLMYCPRCETPVSNFEIAMDNSYKDITEEAVTVKFKLKNEPNTFILAWTTTPWTLPGNVALAVGGGIDYVRAQVGDATYIVAKEKASTLGEHTVTKEFKGNELVGLSYEPIFDVPALQSEKSYKVYAADFVNTQDGTGVVHTAVAYGEDDYQLGLREGLPVVPLLDEKGRYNEKAPEFLRGQYIKDAERFIKKDLEERGLMFKREQHLHSYPHCWRCSTPLYYNAIRAWFVNVQKVKQDLLRTNAEGMNWYPAHLKLGRYAKSVESAPDWNISRNRYWGNPIPVWKCDGCDKNRVIGSIRELGLERNTLYFSRHGEAESNALSVLSSYPEPTPYHLTPRGAEEARALGARIKAAGGVDMIYASDILRTKETAEIVSEILGGVPITFDERLREYNLGTWNGRSVEEWNLAFPWASRWEKGPEGGETHRDIEKRIVAFTEEIDRANQGKRILVVSHEDVLRLLRQYYGANTVPVGFAQEFKLDVSVRDFHRPMIDDISLTCESCGGAMHRTPEIFDSWIEAGSMPFAEYHAPFENEEIFQSRFPGQFIVEYIAQTRSWFYVLHVMSFSLFGKIPVENLVTTGTILAEDGSKMSKSKNNFPDPWETIDKFGIDAIRFYLMNSVVMQADDMNFTLQDLQKLYRKVIMILANVYNYFATYAKEKDWKLGSTPAAPENALDIWITARTKELVNDVTGYLDAYDTVRATRTMESYIDDLSTWYLRRSRGRDDDAFFRTLYGTLITVSKVIAPVMPFLAEAIYGSLLDEFAGQKDIVSVHLEDWPAAQEISAEEKAMLEAMATVREAASLGQAIRQQASLPVRQPLPALAVTLKSGTALSEELSQILLDELNIKALDPTLLGGKADSADEAVKTLPGTKLVETIALGTAITPELKREGLARSLERAVQELRKKMGLKVGEIVKLRYQSSDTDIEQAFNFFNKEKTYVSDIAKGIENESEKIEIENKEVAIGLLRT